MSRAQYMNEKCCGKRALCEGEVRAQFGLVRRLIIHRPRNPDQARDLEQEAVRRVYCFFQLCAR
jgi:hypothetical protein